MSISRDPFVRYSFHCKPKSIPLMRRELHIINIPKVITGATAREAKAASNNSSSTNLFHKVASKSVDYWPTCIDIQQNNSCESNQFSQNQNLISTQHVPSKQELAFISLVLQLQFRSNKPTDQLQLIPTGQRYYGQNCPIRPLKALPPPWGQP